MARKIEWEISLEGYGPQCTVAAPTRSAALGMAEAQWLKDTEGYRGPITDEDGTFYPALEMPTYTAKKLH
jgi:hypothetical protein